MSSVFEDMANSYFPKSNFTKTSEEDAELNTVGSSIIANTNPNTSTTQQYADSNADVDSFTDNIASLLNDTWEDGWGYLTMEEPTGNDIEKTPLPAVTFDVVHRIPSNSKKGLKPRLTEIRLDPTDENYTLIVSRNWFDYTIEFMFFDKTNRGSRVLMNRFETFIETYIGFFKENGVSEMIFSEEVDSRLSKKYKDHIPSTCLRYLLVMERISVQRVRTTNVIRSKIQATKSGSITEQGLNVISQL